MLYVHWLDEYYQHSSSFPYHKHLHRVSDSYVQRAETECKCLLTFTMHTCILTLNLLTFVPVDQYRTSHQVHCAYMPWSQQFHQEEHNQTWRHLNNAIGCVWLHNPFTNNFFLNYTFLTAEPPSPVNYYTTKFIFIL